MAKFPLILWLLLLAGCSFRSSLPHYPLSLQECPKSHGEGRERGIYPVELPDYFIDDRFPYREGEKFGYLPRRFARSLEDFATHCALNYLGGCLYPWECDRQPEERVRIEIEEFYYDKGRKVVILIARVNGREYRIEEKVEEDPLQGALRAYRRLLHQIGR